MIPCGNRHVGVQANSADHRAPSSGYEGELVRVDELADAWHAVEDDRVKVQVHIQGVAEALDESDYSATRSAARGPTGGRAHGG